MALISPLYKMIPIGIKGKIILPLKGFPPRIAFIKASKPKAHKISMNHIVYICGALSHYLYKVRDYKSPKSKKNTWKAELGHTAY